MGRKGALAVAVVVGGALFFATRLSNEKLEQQREEVVQANMRHLDEAQPTMITTTPSDALPPPAPAGKWSLPQVLAISIVLTILGLGVMRYVGQTKRRKRTASTSEGRDLVEVGPSPRSAESVVHVSTEGEPGAAARAKLGRSDDADVLHCTPPGRSIDTAGSSSVRTDLDVGIGRSSTISELRDPADLASRTDSPVSSTASSSVRRAILRALPSDNEGWNVLHIAASTNAIETLKRFLRSSSFAGKVNSLDKRRRTPAHVAAHYGHHIALEALVDRGADLNLKDDTGRSVAEIALKSWQCLRVLVARGGCHADFVRWREDSTQRSILSLACGERDAEDIAQLLVELAPELIDQADAEGRTPLHYAAEYGLSGTVQMLVGRSSGLVGVRDAKGVLPAHVAAHCGVLGVVECVLEATAATVGPIATLTDSSGRTAQHYAVRALRESPSADQAAIVELLEKYGCPRKAAESSLA